MYLYFYEWSQRYFHVPLYISQPNNKWLRTKQGSFCDTQTAKGMLRVGIYSIFHPWGFKWLQWGNELKAATLTLFPTTFKFDKEYSISTCRPITLKIGNYSEFQLAHQWKYSRATALTTNFVSQWKINGKPACWKNQNIGRLIDSMLQITWIVVQIRNTFLMIWLNLSILEKDLLCDQHLLDVSFIEVYF